MAQYMFSTGRLTAMPVGGGAPLQFGALQGVSVDFTADVKELYGRNSFAVDIARGKVKVQGKASTGLINVDLYNTLFFGQTTTTGQTLVSDNEAQTGAASTTVTNSANFLYDMGVAYATTGLFLVLGVSAVAGVSYTVSAGVYVFAGSDIGKAFLITYAYSAAGTGKTLLINNTLMGNVPAFQVVANGVFKTKQITLTLYSCVSSKFNLPLKQDDYTIGEFDFMAQDNGAGAVGSLTVTNT